MKLLKTIKNQKFYQFQISHDLVVEVKIKLWLFKSRKSESPEAIRIPK